MDKVVVGCWRSDLGFGFFDRPLCPMLGSDLWSIFMYMCMLSVA